MIVHVQEHVYICTYTHLLISCNPDDAIKWWCAKWGDICLTYDEKILQTNKARCGINWSQPSGRFSTCFKTQCCCYILILLSTSPMTRLKTNNYFITVNTCWLHLQMWGLSLFYVTVNWIYLCFWLFVGQNKQFEVGTLDSWKLWFAIFWKMYHLIIDTLAVWSLNNKWQSKHRFSDAVTGLFTSAMFVNTWVKLACIFLYDQAEFLFQSHSLFYMNMPTIFTKLQTGPLMPSFLASQSVCV